MKRIEHLVSFRCPSCKKRLKGSVRDAGRCCRCTRCSQLIKIPQPLAAAPPGNPQPAVNPVMAPAQQQGTVPLKLTLPKNLGGMETTVSQNTANGMAKVVTGGFLVVLGVVVAALFGLRRPSA